MSTDFSNTPSDDDSTGASNGGTDPAGIPDPNGAADADPRPPTGPPPDDDAPPDDPNVADTTQAEAINNGFIARQQQLLYTDPNAFYRKTGEDALIGTPGILDQLQDLHRETLDLAPTPGVRRRLQSALDSHLGLSRDDVLRHTRREAKAWQATTASNRIGLLSKQAALQYNDPNSVAAFAFAAANAGRAHARVTNGDPNASAAAAASSVWRNAIEGALAQGDIGSAGVLHANAADALAPTDANAVANQMAAAQERAMGRRFADSQPMPTTDPNAPVEVAKALALLDDAHEAATAQNDTEWAHDPNQQATNQHFIDVRFGTAKRDVMQAKADLNKTVVNWLNQPGQTERPPLTVWTQMSPAEQKAADSMLAQNAQSPNGRKEKLVGTAQDSEIAQATPDAANDNERNYVCTEAVYSCLANQPPNAPPKWRSSCHTAETACNIVVNQSRAAPFPSGAVVIFPDKSHVTVPAGSRGKARYTPTPSAR